MPSTERCGTPGDANTAIGGVPIFHYFDFASRGRGQVVRLLWEDAGIAYDDVRYSFEEYPEYQKTKIAELNPMGKIPVVELDGKILTQSYPMLRHFARLLGKYDGNNEDEKYLADVICDIVIDWRTLFVGAFLNPNKDKTYPEHQMTTQRENLQAVEKHLTSSPISSQGDYILGKTFTYADMALYQVLHDESLVQDGRSGLKDYPRLTKLVDALEERPNIKAFLQSERYRG